MPLSSSTLSRMPFILLRPAAIFFLPFFDKLSLSPGDLWLFSASELMHVRLMDVTVSISDIWKALTSLASHQPSKYPSRQKNTYSMIVPSACIFLVSKHRYEHILNTRDKQKSKSIVLIEIMILNFLQDIIYNLCLLLVKFMRNVYMQLKHKQSEMCENLF